MEKRLIYEMKGTYRDRFRITGYAFGGGHPSLCIVGSSRGNEVQQVYCCSQLIKKCRQLEEEGRIQEGHGILILPSINPYSMNIQKRFWSTDNTDINRMFPGYDKGETTQRIAAAVFEKVSSYDYGIQFTSFYMPGEFVPHVKYMDEGYSDYETAKLFGLPYVVERKTRSYDTTTLNFNWQVWNTKAYSLYTSSTSKIDQVSAGRAVMAVMNFMGSLGLIRYHVVGRVSHRRVRDTDLIGVRTEKSGIYESLVRAGERVCMGQALAHIIHPYEGEIMETLYAPTDGILFFVHNDPLTYANTVVIKILEDEV